MQFGRDGDLHVVARTTGPTHNYLGLELVATGPTDDDTAPIAVERIVLDADERALLDADDVREQVLAGVEDASCELGTDLRVVRIRFVVSDSPPASIYRGLAHRLAERAVAESS